MNKGIIMAAAIVSIIALFYACGGNETKPSAEQAPAPAVSEKPVAEGVNGEQVFKKTCIACHQANGEGIANAFPPLAKSDFLSDRSQVINQVINGKTGEITVNGVKYNSSMPPQALSDEEIAAVLTYVYSSWGNSGSPVTADEVKTVRAKKI
jgi:nitrite reductase (NO-forming)